MQTILVAEPGSPRKSNPSVPRDLEAIVLKCLEKDKARRYATAGELAADLGRFLRNEPVTARLSSPWELTVKWMRRRPAIAALSAAVFLVGLIGTGGGPLAVADGGCQRQGGAHRATRLRHTKEAKEQEKKALIARDEAKRQRDVARLTAYVAHMNLAQREWEDTHVARVLDLLEGERPSEGETDLRGFEWFYLNRLCHSDLRTLKGHTGSVMAWRSAPTDVASPRPAPIRRSRSGTPAPAGVAHAQGTHRRTSMAWRSAPTDAASPRPAPIRRSRSGTPAPARRRSRSRDTPARQWRGVQPRRPPHRLGQLRSDGQGLGRRLRPGDAHAQGTHRHRQGRGVQPRRPPHRLGQRDETVKVWDAGSGQETLTLKGHTDTVRGVAFSPDGRRIASASEDNTVKVWDADSGQETLTLKGHTGTVNGVAFSPDGRRIASASHDAYGQGLGRRLRPGDAHAQGTHRRRLGRGVQPRRPPHRLSQLG